MPFLTHTVAVGDPLLPLIPTSSDTPVRKRRCPWVLHWKVLPKNSSKKITLLPRKLCLQPSLDTAAKGRKSIFSYYFTVKSENLFVNWIKPSKNTSVCLLKTRKISHRHSSRMQPCNLKSALSRFILCWDSFLSSLFLQEIPIAKCHQDSAALQLLSLQQESGRGVTPNLCLGRQLLPNPHLVSQSVNGEYELEPSRSQLLLKWQSGVLTVESIPYPWASQTLGSPNAAIEFCMSRPLQSASWNLISSLPSCGQVKDLVAKTKISFPHFSLREQQTSSFQIVQGEASHPREAVIPELTPVASCWSVPSTGRGCLCNGKPHTTSKDKVLLMTLRGPSGHSLGDSIQLSTLSWHK